MSIPIAVKLYKNGNQQSYPERFMTLSYGAGFEYRTSYFYPKRIVNQVLQSLSMAEDYTKEKMTLNIPEFDLIKIYYNGMIISKDMNSSMIKVEGDIPTGVSINLDEVE